MGDVKRRRVEGQRSSSSGPRSFDVRAWLRGCPGEGHLDVGERVACFRKSHGGYEIRRPCEARPPLIREPPIGADLNEGLQKTEMAITQKKRVEASLPDPAADNPVDPVVEAVGQRSSDVVTFRNNLNKIGFTLYNNRDPWQFDAAVIDEVLYLDIRDPYPDDCPPLLQHYGRRLEELVTGRMEDEEFCSITSIRLGFLHIYVAAEIDAEDKDGRFVEVKCAIQPSKEHQWRTYNNIKLCKFWLQSAIVNVPTVLVCFRSQQGRVEGSTWLRTNEIPGDARRQGARWSEGQILKFLEDVLTWLKGICQDGVQLRVTYDPKAQLISTNHVDGDMAVRISTAKKKS